MKKALIAGAASLAIAAMPVVGVFAATPTSTSFEDDLEITVDGGCTLETSGTENNGSYANRSLSASIVAGTQATLGNAAADTEASTAADATITVSCNTNDNTKTWTVTAKSGKDDGETTPKAALIGETATNKIVSNGTTLGGATSNWVMNLNASAGTSSYNTNAAVPATETTVLTASASTTGVTFRPTYTIFVSPTQAPDTYSGSVIYTIALGA